MIEDIQSRINEIGNKAGIESTGNCGIGLNCDIITVNHL